MPPRKHDDEAAPNPEEDTPLFDRCGEAAEAAPFLDDVDEYGNEIEDTAEDHGGTASDRLGERDTRPPWKRNLRLLPEDDAQALYRKAAAGHRAARNELMERYWPLCAGIAAQYRGDLPIEEATSAAMFGLSKAIRRGGFKPVVVDKDGNEVRVTLATYFRPRMRKEIVKEKVNRHAGFEKAVIDPDGDADGDALTKQDEPRRPRKPRLIAPTWGWPLEADLIENEHAADAKAAILYSAAEVLDPRERRIFEARYLGDGRPVKLRELAVEYSRTLQRIHQIGSVAKKKVADAVRTNGLRPRELCDLGLPPASAASLEQALATLTQCELHVFNTRRLTRFPAPHAVIGRAFAINEAVCLDVEIEATMKIYRLVPEALLQLRRPPRPRTNPVLRVLETCPIKVAAALPHASPETIARLVKSVPRTLRDLGFSAVTAARMPHASRDDFGRGLDRQWLGWTFGFGRLASNCPSPAVVAVVLRARAEALKRKRATPEAAAEAAWRAHVKKHPRKRRSAAIVTN